MTQPTPAPTPDPDLPPVVVPPSAPATGTPSWIPESVAEIRKFITAAAGLIAIAITQGLISGTAAKWVAVALGFATALGVYVVPNGSSAAAEESGLRSV
jgi:hypothetical protein